MVWLVVLGGKYIIEYIMRIIIESEIKPYQTN